MRIARSFSTSLRQAKPYLRSRNKEQKKTARKVMNGNSSHCHGYLNKDLAFLLHAFDVPRSILFDRRQTVERVEEIIKAAFGPNYSIIDRSLSTYARDVDVAPLELAVHDNSRPRGFPPSTEGEPLPEPYKHEVLAKLLQKHGYTGCFVASDPERNLPPQHRHKSSVTSPILQRGLLPVNPPWPSFTPHSSPYPTYSPVLYAEHTSNATLPFFLSPPMPTHTFLIHLLRTYTSLNESFADLISLVFIWARSIDLSQLTPTCIALMVIAFLQNRKLLVSLQNPSDPEQVWKLAEADEGVWVRDERLPQYSTKAFWLETGFLKPPVTKVPTATELGPLFVDFFHFWGEEIPATNFIDRAQAFSIREGPATLRMRVMTPTENTQKRGGRNQDLIDRGEVPWSFPGQPIMRQTQPIAILDPFMPSYNHAQSMSKAAYSYFHYYNSLSYHTLRRGHPATTVLGPYLPAPRGLIQAKPKYNFPYSTHAIMSETKQMYESQLPSPHILAARERTISRVRNVIRNTFGVDYSVECFGSTRYGVSSATSDLDLVILDLKRMEGFSPDLRLTRLPDVYDTRLVARTLRRNGFIQVFAIPNATVPIVKFRDPTTGLECDLNTNDQLGLWNTLLIEQYCDLAPDVVRPTMMVVKRWAKSHGLNDPSGQNGPVTFSSYALVLMVIGYLQAKGVLPNLQADLDLLPEEPVFWIRTKKGDPVRCDTRFLVKEGWKSGVQLELDEVVTGWFSFWAKEVNYDEQLLNIREGGLIKRAQKQLKKVKEKKEKQSVAQALEGMSLNQEQQEDDVVSAFVHESEGEATEDEGSRGELDIIDMAVEGDSVNGVEMHDQQPYEDTDDGSEGVLYEPLQGYQKPGVPPAAEVGFIPFEETQMQLNTDSGLQVSGQPSQWRSHELIVVDPFILSKNVCGNVTQNNVARFKAECLRSVQLLSWGAKIQDLMGDGKSIPGVPRRGRGGKQRRSAGKGGRSRNKEGDGRGETAIETTPGRGAGGIGIDLVRGQHRKPGQFGHGIGRGGEGRRGVPPKRTPAGPSRTHPTGFTPTSGAKAMDRPRAH